LQVSSVFKNISPRIFIWAIFIAIAVYIFIQALQKDN